MKRRLQTILWHHNARVNSHQRWKQTRFHVCFHLWCELTNTIDVTEWQVSWNLCISIPQKDLAVKSRYSIDYIHQAMWIAFSLKSMQLKFNENTTFHPNITQNVCNYIVYKWHQYELWSLLTICTNYYGNQQRKNAENSDYFGHFSSATTVSHDHSERDSPIWKVGHEMCHSLWLVHPNDVNEARISNEVILAPLHSWTR